ncbi:putative ABC transport system permease protein [Kitasatospora gansuensis]|uniref:Putative ABC transport system permease protein n=1 Tax=Kitasatospora gansuensis TaxID=258050 RepID=A0A7W7SJQ8_9ACTN|nr:ABC transporter permease [Kitasatospora gansuensis]MBB4951759.1 putative ABC transport system permease protein [Kitasatospora gansuensis]
MNVLALAAANVLALWRRFLGLALLLTVTTALCVTAFGITHQAETTARDRVREATANRSVVVDRLPDRADAKPLSAATVRTLAALPAAESVEPRAQVSFGYKDDTVAGVLLYATTARASQPPPVLASTRAALFPLADGEIVLPRRSQGSDLSPLLGRTLTVTTTRQTGDGEGTGDSATVTVVGLFDPGWQLDGPDAAYTNDSTVLRWAAARAGVPETDYLDTVGYGRITVVARTAQDVPALLHAVQTAGYAAVSTQQELTELPAALDLIRLAGRALLAVLAVLALLGTVVLTGALARQRTREVGILKAVGFGTRHVLTMLLAETALVTALSAAAGITLGLTGATAAATALRHDPSLAPYLPHHLPLPTTGLLAALTALLLAITLLGAWHPAHRAARLAPGDAIKEW